MKKTIFACLISFAFLSVKAQEYNALADSMRKLKVEGKLTGEESYINPNAKEEPLQITHPSVKRGSHNNNTMSSTLCNCWIPRDTSFHVVPFVGNASSPGVAPTYANDDGYTNAMTLPFSFCMYGTSMGSGSNKLYINNNGNISFGAPFSTYSAAGFPSSLYKMVAPFWGDVETTNPGSGFVYYQLTATHLIIQWDSVTCFQTGGANAANAHLKNTFQLIITDGTDPILSAGNNISFCYGDMQWTTGDASNASPINSGFGGTPATVGINKGDGVNYIQISRFGNSGSTFTNPAGSPASGIGWLAHKSFYFDACGSGTNLPPLSTAGGSSCGGDTLAICAVGDTLTQLVSFTGPEPSQLVTVTASAPTIGSGFSILSTTVGTTGSLIFQVASGTLTANNYYNVSVTGTDNGTPIQSTTLNYVIHVLNAPIPTPTIVVNPSSTCGNTPAILTLSNPNDYDSYTWSTGATTFSTSVVTTTTVHITVVKNGCSKTGSAIAYFYPKPHATISGALSYCPPSTGTNLTANGTNGTSPYSYNWNNGAASTQTFQAVGSPTLGVGYSVTITDAHGCKDSTSVTVVGTASLSLSIASAGNLCATPPVDTLISSITNATSYAWTPAGTGSSNSTYIVNLPGVYHLTVAINGCTVSQSYTLAPPITPTLTIGGIPTLCSGDSTSLNVSSTPAGSYSYTWYQGTSAIGTNTVQTIYTTGSYNVIGVNNNTQCKSLPTVVTVASYSNPIVSIQDQSGSNTYCRFSGDTLTATASGGNGPYTYTWTPSSPTATTYTYYAIPAVNAISTTYSVIVKDSKGCMAISSIPLKPDNPRIFIPNSSFCPGKYTVLSANGSTGALTYTWYPGGIVSKKDTIRVPGTYTVVMTDQFGCTAKDSTIMVTQNPAPQAQFNYSPTSVEAGLPITFNSISTVTTGSISTYAWTFGDVNNNTDSVSSPTHIYNNGGTYTVSLIVKSDKGCLDTIPGIVNVQYVVTAPNIITPNGDGINELLIFKNLEYFKNNKLQVFNRWGTRFYQDNDYKNNWSSKDLSDGTYFYILEMPDKNKTLNGFFESIK